MVPRRSVAASEDTACPMVNYGYQIEKYIDAGGLCTRIMALAVTIADEYGLTDESELRRCLPDPSWLAHWDRIVEVCGFHRICGQLAIKRTRKTEVAAALMAIGKPATIAKIEARLAPELNGDSFRISSVISQMDGVIRASKTEWGFEDWIDDEYEGIPAEIVQRINEDDGSTRLNRLLDEIPRLFRVTEASVWAYLNTPAFRVEHGWVSEVHEHEFQLAQLDDVIDGYDEAGEPYWTFEIAQRHLDGYSLHGVPPEIAAALGCNFGGRSTASVRQPQGCQDISVIWRKTSIHGPEIGRLSKVLHALNAHHGSTLRLVIHGSSVVSIRTSDHASLTTESSGLREARTSEAVAPTRFSGVRDASSLRAVLGPRVAPAEPSQSSTTRPVDRLGGHPDKSTEPLG